MEAPIYQKISGLERGIITVIVMVGAFMAILDTTIVDIIVPKITAPLQTDYYGVQWVITAYMMASATMLILAEWLDKNFGLRKIYILGVAVFTLASFWCGVSSSLEEMITARALQGVGEAFIMATSQTILFSVYPPEKKGIAMGIFGLGVSFAPSIGPTLGGYITEYLDWRWVFFINVPFGILTVISAIFFLPETSLKRVKESLNFISFGLLSTFTISTLILLSKGQQYGWFNSDLIVYLFIISIFALLLYLLSELISKKPLIDFSIFKDKNFFVGLSVYFLLLGFSMYQIFYLIPIYFENLKQLSTLEAGIHILGMAFFIALFSPIAGLLSDKIGEKYVLYMAGILYILSALVILPSLDYFTPSIKGALMLIPLGTSMGMFFAPATTLALRNLGEKTSLGTGLLHYSRFIGGSFGTAIATNNLYKYSYEHFDGVTQMQETGFISQKLAEFKAMFLESFDMEKAEKLSNALLYKLQSLYALSWSFQDTFFIAGLWGVLGALPLLILVYLDLKSKLFSK